jgi:hypothetical protein
VVTACVGVLPHKEFNQTAGGQCTRHSAVSIEGKESTAKRALNESTENRVVASNTGQSVVVASHSAGVAHWETWHRKHWVPPAVGQGLARQGEKRANKLNRVHSLGVGASRPPESFLHRPDINRARGSRATVHTERGSWRAPTRPPSRGSAQMCAAAAGGCDQQGRQRPRSPATS